MKRSFAWTHGHYDPKQADHKLTLEEYRERHDIPEQFCEIRWRIYCGIWDEANK